jgi:hypothetical protein
MAQQSLTVEEVRTMAARIGMTHLEEQHVQELSRATVAARARRDALPIATLTPADEPAHVFRVTTDANP